MASGWPGKGHETLLENILETTFHEGGCMKRRKDLTARLDLTLERA
jgi:hypothetical protein